jgi:hypothetical protein
MDLATSVGRRTWLLAAALAWLAAALPASAQPREPTLAELSLMWAAGDWAAPVVCPLPEGPRRVARAVRIEPPRETGHRPSHWVRIAPLGVGGVRCTNELGQEEPDLEGRLRIALPGRWRPDNARLDLQQALRRSGGFRFEVLEGKVTVRGSEGTRGVELGGGTAELTEVVPGSDAARMLGELGDTPRRTLALEARDGTRLVLHMVGVGQR